MRWAGLIVVAALLAGSQPSRAWDIRDDPSFSFFFHSYGGDMNPPAATPLRPYWHEDSAVPPAMRWHDRSIELVDEYGFTVATAVPPPEVVVGVEAEPLPPPVPLPPAIHVPRRHVTRKAVARRVCPPVVPPIALAPPDVPHSPLGPSNPPPLLELPRVN